MTTIRTCFEVTKTVCASIPDHVKIWGKEIEYTENYYNDEETIRYCGRIYLKNDEDDKNYADVEIDLNGYGGIMIDLEVMIDGKIVVPFNRRWGECKVRPDGDLINSKDLIECYARDLTRRIRKAMVREEKKRMEKAGEGTE